MILRLMILKLMILSNDIKTIFYFIAGSLLYYYYSLKVFHISVSWWSSTGVWVTASLLKSPGLFSVFWPISINLVFRMVFICPLISKSSSPFINPYVIVPRALITIGINVTFVIHSFFSSLARSKYLSFFSISFNFTLLSAETTTKKRTCTIAQVLFLVVVDYHKVW